MRDIIKYNNTETIYPWEMVENVVAISKEKNAKIATYSDCRLEESILANPYKYIIIPSCWTKRLVMQR
jgi:hypothetical protein